MEFIHIVKKRVNWFLTNRRRWVLRGASALFTYVGGNEERCIVGNVVATGTQNALFLKFV